MAGDWIKMRCNLWTHPKVALMAMRTRQPKTMIVGALHGAWGILDQHGEEGVLGGMSADMLDAQVEVEGFAAAMESVGWLTQVDGGLEFPNYEEHNGATAKRRASEAKRKGNVRKASASCPQGVRNPSATRPHRCGHIADKSAHHAEQIREEEKREEEKRLNPPLSPQGETTGEAKPKKSRKKPATVEHYIEAQPSLDSPRLREMLSAWLQQRKASGKTIYAGMPTVSQQAAFLASMPEADAVESLRQSIVGGYQGLFEPKGRGSPQRGVDVDQLNLDSQPEGAW